MKNVRITKKMVEKTIDILKEEIAETRNAAFQDDNVLYGRYLAEEKSALETLACVIECGYPMKSKKVRAIVAKYY